MEKYGYQLIKISDIHKESIGHKSIMRFNFGFDIFIRFSLCHILDNIHSRDLKVNIKQKYENVNERLFQIGPS